VSNSDESTAEPSQFAPTRWSVVLAAKDKCSPDSAAALEVLCRTYWYPLYAFIRRQGHSSHDAQDLTQGFFARLLEKDYLRAAAREKGRFRTFLRVALKRFLANEWDRSRTLKRGRGTFSISLDASAGEERYRCEMSDTLPPERIYDQRWAMTLLEQAMSRLRTEYGNAGKMAEFQQMKRALTADRGAIAYGEIAGALGMTEGAARVAVHRLRKRFRELCRDAVADTVAGPEEVEDELRYLVEILSSDRL
jgi:RNA polymerase sigma factor (sigma-70 family)